MVNIEPGCGGCLYIFKTICKCKGQFLNEISSGFLHMISGNGYRVEFRHMPGCVRNNVRHDPHGGFWRIDIGIPHHKFF